MAFALSLRVPDQKNAHVYRLIENIFYNFYQGDMPYFIGISGPGGAGKTFFAENITKFFGGKNCTQIHLDDYMMAREERRKFGYTGENPNANNMDLARSNLLDLRSNRSTKKPIYNHADGTVLQDEEIIPNKIIVVEGLSTFFPELRELYNLSFFLDASEKVQIKSKVERDVKERGYTLEKALELFANIQPQYKEFIEPTKEFANVICGVDINYIMTPQKLNLFKPVTRI
ncbi:MAG: hypothetical protein Q8R00_02755 [Candidatus Nanoarchaeia archaeon]|nr:hypothetical protein [Candidatus Nanoarchaeia archaeon]